MSGVVQLLGSPTLIMRGHLLRWCVSHATQVRHIAMSCRLMSYISYV